VIEKTSVALVFQVKQAAIQCREVSGEIQSVPPPITEGEALPKMTDLHRSKELQISSMMAFTVNETRSQKRMPPPLY
jgi:hypothetical protein